MFNNHQNNYSIDSPLIRKDDFINKNATDAINREIKQIGQMALQQTKTININSEQYKYFIRIVEISGKTNLVEKNEKLLDDIIEELSILITLDQKSKTIQSFLNRMYQLYKRKKRDTCHTENKNRENALLNNFESQRISSNQQKSSLSPHTLTIKVRPIQCSEPKHQNNLESSLRNEYYKMIPNSTKREQIKCYNKF